MLNPSFSTQSGSGRRVATEAQLPRAPQFLVLLCMVVAAAGFPEPGVAESPLEFEEYFARETISSPRLSPDGQHVVFVLGSRQTWDSPRITRLWLMAASGGEPRQLTNAAVSDWSPAWSPDSRTVAFLSERAGAPQVYLISLDGGEARQLTTADNGVTTFRWVDDETLAFLSDEGRDPELEAAEEAGGGGFVVGSTGRRSALWRQSVAAGSTAERITDGSFFIDTFAAAPGGGHFLLVAAPTSDLYTLISAPELRLVDGEGATVRTMRPGTNLSDPEFAPDGRHFSVVGCSVGYSPNDGLFVMAVDDEMIRNLTHELDPTIMESQWSDNETISFTSLHGPNSAIYSVTLDGSPVRTLVSPEWVMFSHSGPDAEGRLVLEASSGTTPQRLLLVDTSGDDTPVRVLYDPTPWLGERQLATTEILHYQSFDGTQLNAVLTLPLEEPPTAGAPLMVMPHGGPDGMSLDDFSFVPQLFAAAGFMVFEPNFRGSIGQGRDIYVANRGRIGDVDYRDIIAGVDALIAAGRVDPERMVVGGWSFGGTMTNWIATHDCRFKAAVAVAGASNYLSRYGTSDVNHGVLARWEFERTPLEDLDFFLRFSPFAHAGRCSTPVLLLHGEKDSRVPLGQAHEMYRALQDKGVPSQLVIYPGADHEISDPHQKRDVYRRWLEWYRSWCPSSAQPSANALPVENPVGSFRAQKRF